MVRRMILPTGDLGRVETAAHEAFDRENGALGVGHGLALGRIAHQTFLVGESHDGRRGAASVGVGDALGFLALHHVNATVGGTQVYAYNLAHM